MTTPYKLEPLANYHCRIGENPLWDAEHATIFWTDIPTGRLFKLDAATGRHEQFYDGEPVGGFTFQEDGSLLLFRVNEIVRLAPGGEIEVLVSGIDDDMERFNDVIADPAGRVYAGTIGRNDDVGGLYRVDLDGSVTSLFKGTGCANGMAFTADHRRFYWTCSTTRRIFRFDYARDTGELTNRELIVTVAKDQGVPDGLTLDTEGNVWSARWNGHGIYRFAPSGEQLEKIDFPVAKVSSVTFGGEHLDELYATTAGGTPDADTPDGTLYRLKVPARGLPEFRSRILLPPG